MRDSFAKHYGQVIDHIISQMDVKSDEIDKVRNRIANALERSMKQSQRKGGTITDPLHTKIYKLTNIIHDTRSWEEFDQRCRQVFHRSGTLILEMFGSYDWKFNFPINQMLKSKEEHPRGGIKELWDVVNQLRSDIDDLQTIILALQDNPAINGKHEPGGVYNLALSNLDSIVEKLRHQLADHIHLADGRAVGTFSLKVE